MNRVKRDYCSKNYHPDWRAWKAIYNTQDILWPWVGNFCTFCGGRVKGKGGGAMPKTTVSPRLRVFRGIYCKDGGGADG